jgi:hypothetical protein
MKKTMKSGDIVMFVDNGRYAKWFFGQLAEVIHYTHPEESDDGKAHCRVRWLQSVNYHGSFASISDFPTDKFEIV